MPHPENDADELKNGMAHLMVEKDEEEPESDEEDSSKDSFKDRIETIMKATEADGKDRDEELKVVVSEMLAAAGPERAAALAKELQAQMDN